MEAQGALQCPLTRAGIPFAVGPILIKLQTKLAPMMGGMGGMPPGPK